MTEDLDPIFAEPAARMSAQLDELTQTRVEYGDGKDLIEIPGPLVGYTKEPFFEPAIALTGQDLELVEALYNVVNEVWMHADEHAPGFQSGMSVVLSNWSGTAAIECGKYVGDLVGFVTNEQQCLLTFAQGLATYAAIIKEARTGLKELMSSCVSGWDQATQAGEIADINVAITALTGITGLGFSAISGGTTLPAFGTALLGIAGTATNIQLNLSGKHADIANAYLKASRDIIAQACDAIGTNAIPWLDRVRDDLPQLPVLPPGVNDRGTFHPQNEQPAGHTAGGIASRRGPGTPPSTIQNTLG